MHSGDTDTLRVHKEAYVLPRAAPSFLARPCRKRGRTPRAGASLRAARHCARVKGRARCIYKQLSNSHELPSALTDPPRSCPVSLLLTGHAGGRNHDITAATLAVPLAILVASQLSRSTLSWVLPKHLHQLRAGHTRGAVYSTGGG
jgi:hypothetical protein